MPLQAPQPRPSQPNPAPPDRAALEQDVYRLEVLGQIKQAVLVDQSPRRFAETAFHHLQKIVPFDTANVILFDFEREKGWVLAAVGQTITGLEPGDTFPLADCLASPHDLRTQVPLDPALLQPQPSCLLESRLHSLGLQAYLSHLLISHGAVIGTLNIASHHPQPYDEGAVRTARDVADSLAVAIQKAMLFEQTRLKAAELSALSNLSSELRRTESWDAIIAIIRAETERAFQASASAFLSRRGASVQIVAGSEAPLRWKQADHPDPALWELLDQDEPLFSGRPVPALAGLLPDLPTPASCLLLPLKTGSRWIGKLLLGFAQHREFSTEEERLAVSMADIAGNALDRASVMETLEERVASRTRQLSTLYHISNTINYTLDLAEVLERSLEFLQQAAEVGVSVHLIENPAQPPTLSASRGFPDAYLPHLQTLAAQVAQQDGLVTLQTPPDSELPYSYAGLPLKGRQQTLGVLSLLSTRPKPFREDSLALLSGVADPLSIAVQNDQLRRRAEESIVIEERQRLARELHDSISQLLYSQLLFAQAGQRAYENGDLELLPLYLNRLGEVAEQAFKEMRLMIYSLRPQVLESEGLTGALQHRLTTVERRAGLDARLDFPPDLKLPAPLEDTLFRIAQEALNNTLKHASATAVSLRLQVVGDQASLTIADNGKGFARPQVVTGFGFASMQERARQMGGQLTIESQPGQGTTVAALVPIPRTQGEA